MSAYRRTAVAVLLLLFASLSVSLSIYAHLQQAILLEGNQLYSNDAVVVKAPPDQIISTLSSANANARVYRSLTDDGRVRAVLKTGANVSAIPTRDGSQFADGDSREAMVGSDVPVEQIGGRPHYEFNGTVYPVIATLGMREKSLLASDVLIKDATYFDGDPSDGIVVDGAGGKSAIAQAFDPSTYAPLSSGTERRTNIDYVSPILLVFGWCLVGLGIVITGGLAAKYSKKRNYIEHQLGRPHHVIVLRNTFTLTILVVISVVPAAVLAISTPIARASATHSLSTILGELVVVLLIFAVSTTYEMRGRRQWV